jgi:calcium binding protein 39
MMLRECIRVQELAEIILKSSELYKFFDYVQKSTFDIASDAFATFKVRPFTFGDTSNYFLVFRIY